MKTKVEVSLHEPAAPVDLWDITTCFPEMRKEFGPRFDFDPNVFVINWIARFAMNGWWLITAYLPQASYLQGKFAGMIGGMIAPANPDGTLIAHANLWYVRPEYRGQGIGKQLLRSFEAWSEKSGANRMSIYTIMDADPDLLKNMKELYWNEGFKPREVLWEKQFRANEPEE